MSSSLRDESCFVLAVPLDRCRPNEPVFVEVRGRELALVRVGNPDRVYCLENRCPHAGANLAGGRVDDCHLVCPQHHWKFNLETGACDGSPHIGVARHATRIEGGMVYVREMPEPYCPPLDGMGA